MPVGWSGASGKTWPRWEPHVAQRTSVRIMPWLVSTFSTVAPSWAWKKEGHPQEESNFASESKSLDPQAAHE